MTECFAKEGELRKRDNYHFMIIIIYDDSIEMRIVPVSFF